MLGKGSNLVFSNRGFQGLVIYTAPYFSKITWEGSRAVCDAGALTYTLVSQSVKGGYAGVQKLGGIPGTVGGAVYMNAGAYGQEVETSVEWVRSLTLEGELRERNRRECQFEYRHSLFWNLSEYIVEIGLKFNSGERKNLELEMKNSLSHRKLHQPLSLPNSGSVFKRPQNLFPGQVIEEAGLKGLRKGGVEVSPLHANFMINHGGAMAQDLYDLIEEVKAKVKAHSGVILEREVFLIGDFLPWPR